MTQNVIYGAGLRTHHHKKRTIHKKHGGALRELAITGSGNLSTLKSEFAKMSVKSSKPHKKRPKYLSF